MSAIKLFTENFRNLDSQVVVFHPKYNFIIGDNGSGKSSLLEAIFYLAHGKSFRSAKTDNLIAYNQHQFVVSVRDSFDNQLGVSKDSTGTKLKVNGAYIYKLSELAQKIAVQIVTPESFKLFFGGPRDRRKFVDLGMFHVKQEFSTLWKDFSRVLKQRNACLKQRLDSDTLAYWTNEFVSLSERLSQSRAEYVALFIEEFDYWLKILLPSITDKISVIFYQGWSSKKSLVELLAQHRDREYGQGFSQLGAHKFDVKFLHQGTPVEQKLSRGQQKLFLLALTFTQAKLIEQVNRVKPILLIDDIGAELDISSRQNFYSAIEQLDCQVIITAIDETALEPMVQNNKTLKMFHVKHGKISEVSK